MKLSVSNNLNRDFSIFQKYFNNNIKKDDITIDVKELKFTLEKSSLNPRLTYHKQLKKKRKKPSVLTSFMLIEGLFVVNSWMASIDPNGYGGLLMLLAPLGMNDTKMENWIGLGYTEAFGYYNTTIDVEKKSKSTIFKENMIAWHLFTGLSFLTDYLMKDKSSSQKNSVYLIPTYDNGTKIVYNYKF